MIFLKTAFKKCKNSTFIDLYMLAWINIISCFVVLSNDWIQYFCCCVPQQFLRMRTSKFWSRIHVNTTISSIAGWQSEWETEKYIIRAIWIDLGRQCTQREDFNQIILSYTCTYAYTNGNHMHNLYGSNTELYEKPCTFLLEDLNRQKTTEPLKILPEQRTCIAKSRYSSSSNFRLAQASWSTSWSTFVVVSSPALLNSSS